MAGSAAACVGGARSASAPAAGFNPVLSHGGGNKPVTLLFEAEGTAVKIGCARDGVLLFVDRHEDSHNNPSHCNRNAEVDQPVARAIGESP